MTIERDYAAIEVDGLQLDGWQSVSFDADLFSPADAFNLKLGVGTSSSSEMHKNLDRARKALKPGALIKFYVSHAGKMALQGTGLADARQISNSYESGTDLVVQGRDLASPLVDSAADLDLFRKAQAKAKGGQVRLIDLATLAVEPWASLGIKVSADAIGARNVRAGYASSKNPERTRQDLARSLGIPSAKISDKIMDGLNNGTIDPVKLLTGTGKGRGLSASVEAAQIYQLKVKDAATQAGETVWELLSRHARRLGAMLRMGPNGELLIAAIDYNQPARYTLKRQFQRPNENNILSGGGRLDTARVYSTVRVVSRGKNTTGGKRFKLDVTVDDFNESDTSVPFQKVLLVHDDSLRTVDEASNRAAAELAKCRQGAYVLTYTLRGFGSDGNVFATDTIANVIDDVEGISGEYYVIGRTFERSEGAGPSTTLRLVPKDSIVLSEAA
jgi:prophage tail gpP-like protein